MARVGSILSQQVRQKLKSPYKYRKFTAYNNNNIADFKRIIDSKFSPFPVNDDERYKFMQEQKANLVLIFLEKSFKKMSHNGVREINNDNLMVFSILLFNTRKN